MSPEGRGHAHGANGAAKAATGVGSTGGHLQARAARYRLSERGRGSDFMVRRYPLQVPDPFTVPLPDLLGTRKFGPDFKALIPPAQHQASTDSRLTTLSVSAVNTVLPLLGVLGVGSRGEPVEDLVASHALGIALAEREAALGWQKNRKVDTRVWAALAMLGGSALGGYFLRVGYWVGRRGEAGIPEVVGVLVMLQQVQRGSP